jgi:hypothetical protein
MVEFRQNVLTLSEPLRDDIPQPHRVRHLHATAAGAPVLNGAVGDPMVDDLRNATVEARIRAFSRTLHPEKTRLIEFGRFAARNRALRVRSGPRSVVSAAAHRLGAPLNEVLRHGDVQLILPPSRVPPVASLVEAAD